MTTLGAFAPTPDGGFRGAIRTLTLDLPTVELRPLEATGPKAPDFRVTSDGVELGAAWRKAMRGGDTYLLVALDDPALPAPIYARLLGTGDERRLVWTRPRPIN